MLKRFLTIFIILCSCFALFSPTPVAASVEDCTYQGQCVDNLTCYRLGSEDFELRPPECNSAIIGTIEAPQGVAGYNNTGFIGIIYFANQAIRLITVVAGIFVMINFIRAGVMYLASGDDTKSYGDIRDLMTYSVIGLVIIAVTYTIAGLIGLIFFNDASYILDPQLESAIL